MSQQPAAEPVAGPPRPRPLTIGAFAVILAFGGFANALQARANGELTVHLGNGVQAALYSFASGLVLLSILVLARPSLRQGLRRIPAAVREGSLVWWAVPTGVLAGVFIGLQSYSTALIGVALFSVGMVAGQTANSLLVDRVGLAPIGRARITTRRIVSGALALLSVVVAASGRIGDVDFSWLALIAAFVGGCVVAVQQALNGRVNVASREPLATTWLNFAFGTTALLVSALIGAMALGAEVHMPSSGPAWMWLGGICGLSFIATASWAVPRYGVLVFALVTIAGQLTAALLLDLWAPGASGGVTAMLVVGVGLTYAAVVVGAGMVGRRRPAS